MISLTESEQELIKSAGGIPVDKRGKPVKDDWGRIRFEKTNKPSRTIKKLLKEKGYEITKESGRNWECNMEYVLSDTSTTT